MSYKQISFPIILSQVVGSDKQCLSAPKTKLANFKGVLQIVPLKVIVKFNGVLEIFVACLVQNGLTFL